MRHFTAARLDRHGASRLSKNLRRSSSRQPDQAVLKPDPAVARAVLISGVVLFLLIAPAGRVAAQVCVQPPPSLAAWWPGDGNADDLVGTNHGTPSGMTFAAGVVRQGFSFNGRDGFIEVADSPSMEPGAAFTYDAWINPGDLSEFDFLISKTGNGDAFAYYVTVVKGRLRFNASGTGSFFESNIVETATSVIEPNVWQHVAVVYDGGLAAADRVKMYVNGARVDTTFVFGTEVPGSIADTTTSTLLGAYRTHLLFAYSGLMDEVEFFNRALSPAEIQSIFLAGSAGKCNVVIDIKPDSFPNSINPRAQGVVPVAILTTNRFDATTVDPGTISFGATGADTPPVHSAREDVDRDGDTDLILHFRTEDAAIQCSDTSAGVTGASFDGRPIRGSDSIKTVGCK